MKLKEQPNSRQNMNSDTRERKMTNSRRNSPMRQSSWNGRQSFSLSGMMSRKNSIIEAIQAKAAVVSMAPKPKVFTSAKIFQLNRSPVKE